MDKRIGDFLKRMCKAWRPHLTTEETNARLYNFSDEARDIYPIYLGFKSTDKEEITKAECKFCGTGKRELWCGGSRPYPIGTRSEPDKNGGCQEDFKIPWWMNAYRCGTCGIWFHQRCLLLHIKGTGCDITPT